jgi:hypothetical protein
MRINTKRAFNHIWPQNPQGIFTYVILKNDLLKVIDDYPIEIVVLNNQQLVKIEHLANLYIEQGVIPAKKRPDALHIAISTVCNINYLVSWNYRHLTNDGKEQKIKMLNWQQNDLQELGIITPLELLNYES